MPALEQATRLTGMEQATDVNPVHQSLEIDLAKQESELVRTAIAPSDARAPGRYLPARDCVKLANATAAFDDLTQRQKRN